MSELSSERLEEIGSNVCNWKLLLDESCSYSKQIRTILTVNFVSVCFCLVISLSLIAFRVLYLKKRMLKKKSVKIWLKLQPVEGLFVGSTTYFTVRIVQLTTILYFDAPLGFGAYLIELSYTMGYVFMLYFTLSLMEAIPKKFVKNHMDKYNSTMSFFIYFFLIMLFLVNIQPFIIALSAWALKNDYSLSRKLEIAYYSIWVAYLLITSFFALFSNHSISKILKKSYSLFEKMPAKDEIVLEKIKNTLEEIKISTYFSTALMSSICGPVFLLATINPIIFKTRPLALLLIILYEYTPTIIILSHHFIVCIKDHKSHTHTHTTSNEKPSTFQPNSSLQNEDVVIENFRKSICVDESVSI